MTRKKSPSPTIEDYLGIIYTLYRDGEEVYGARLAELLNVSAPTVTVTLQRMVRDKWIRLDGKKKVHLTSTGLKAARDLIRRHMLTEWMLAKILNLPWSEVHDEADRIEHTISTDVEMSLMNTLEDPDCCPHGNPMPGLEKIQNNWTPLTLIETGRKLVIRRIHELLEEDLPLMKFLEENGVIPGAMGQISDTSPYDGPLVISIDDRPVPLEREIAESIYAELK